MHAFCPGDLHILIPMIMPFRKGPLDQALTVLLTEEVQKASNDLLGFAHQVFILDQHETFRTLLNCKPDSVVYITPIPRPRIAALAMVMDQTCDIRVFVIRN